jgi:hypothetical protein
VQKILIFVHSESRSFQTCLQQKKTRRCKFSARAPLFVKFSDSRALSSAAPCSLDCPNTKENARSCSSLRARCRRPSPPLPPPHPSALPCPPVHHLRPYPPPRCGAEAGVTDRVSPRRSWSGFRRSGSGFHRRILGIRASRRGRTSTSRHRLPFPRIRGAFIATRPDLWSFGGGGGSSGVLVILNLRRARPRFPIAQRNHGKRSSYHVPLFCSRI